MDITGSFPVVVRRGDPRHRVLQITVVVRPEFGEPHPVGLRTILEPAVHFLASVRRRTYLTRDRAAGTGGARTARAIYGRMRGLVLGSDCPVNGTATTILLPFLGTLLLFLAMVDAFRTVFHTEARGGPLNKRQNRVVWAAFSVVGRRLHDPARSVWLGYAAPALAVLTPLLWMALLIVGYALVYYPWMPPSSSLRGISRIRVGKRSTSALRAPPPSASGISSRA